jgi:hypothetical protein
MAWRAARAVLTDAPARFAKERDVTRCGRNCAAPCGQGSRARAGAYATAWAIPIVRQHARRTPPARSPRRQRDRAEGESVSWTPGRDLSRRFWRGPACPAYAPASASNSNSRSLGPLKRAAGREAACARGPTTAARARPNQDRAWVLGWSWMSALLVWHIARVQCENGRNRARCPLEESHLAPHVRLFSVDDPAVRGRRADSAITGLSARGIRLLSRSSAQIGSIVARMCSSFAAAMRRSGSTASTSLPSRSAIASSLTPSSTSRKFSR